MFMFICGVLLISSGQGSTVEMRVYEGVTLAVLSAGAFQPRFGRCLVYLFVCTCQKMDSPGLALGDLDVVGGTVIGWEK